MPPKPKKSPNNKKGVPPSSADTPRKITTLERATLSQLFINDLEQYVELNRGFGSLTALTKEWETSFVRYFTLHHTYTTELLNYVKSTAKLTAESYSRLNKPKSKEAQTQTEMCFVATTEEIALIMERKMSISSILGRDTPKTVVKPPSGANQKTGAPPPYSRYPPKSN
uniref:Gag protein n=1 Tax=Panagrellus redivivus TaxID=6233 RepID=A0A7E4ZUX4_PANRE